jgi:hypothetical protein
MMTEIEIEIIRLALDTEIKHKDYAKHNLAAKKVLNANEAENKGQTLPIDSVVKSFTAEQVVAELEDCDTLDDAIMFFKENK